MDEVLRAPALAFERDTNGEAIQIGSPDSFNISSPARKMVEVSGVDCEIGLDKSKPYRDMNRLHDLRNAQTVSGWEPRVSPDHGILQSHKWARNLLVNTL